MNRVCFLVLHQQQLPTPDGRVVPASLSDAGISRLIVYTPPPQFPSRAEAEARSQKHITAFDSPSSPRHRLNTNHTSDASFQQRSKNDHPVVDALIPVEK